MVRNQVILRTTLALLAFAGNSLLCRLALKSTAIDAASFTSLRLLSASLALWPLLVLGNKRGSKQGDWLSAAALFGYAAAFSLAYLNVAAGTGALLLFGSVQMTMIGTGLFRGERFNAMQLIGLALALGGLIYLVFPGLAAPPAISASLMIVAGIAWGIYSLRGRATTDPLATTAGNFLRTLPFTFLFSLLFMGNAKFDLLSGLLAIASGIVASGLGYAIWYSVLPSLKSTQAATVQLSVPVIASIGGIVLLGEQLSLRLILASIVTLSGIGLMIYERGKATVISVRRQ